MTEFGLDYNSTLIVSCWLSVICSFIIDRFNSNKSVVKTTFCVDPIKQEIVHIVVTVDFIWQSQDIQL